MIPIDKQAHALGGYALYLTLILTSPLWAFSLFGATERNVIRVISICAVLVVGLLKEIHDELKKGKFDIWDMLATWLGGGIACLIESFTWGTECG